MKKTTDGKVEEMLNSLLQATFQMNSHADSCAYWLAHNGFVNTQEIFHKKYAHKFPEWADLISDLMIKLSVQPIRKGLEDNDYEYSDYVELFEDVEAELEHYKEIIYRTIDTMETFKNREFVSFLDDYLLELATYTNQTSVWVTKANQNVNDPLSFDKHFESFTFI